MPFVRLALLITALLAAAGAADPPATVLYGAAYYHEYMPNERLDKDVELMKQAGFTVVRLGESTWSSWEPRDGDFQFAWMDRIVDAFHRAGIRVIMGTPTYSIPPWLFKKHPGIVVTRLTKAPPLSNPWSPSYPSSTTPGAYGPRQNMDLLHPAYRSHSERIIRAIAARYARHPAVIGWQVDNETAPNGLALPHVQRAFVEGLKRKYATPHELNRRWGLAYWGQLVDNWDEFPPRDGILNPGYKLAWERFQQSIVTDFLAWQVKLVREYARPDQFVTHDFVGGVRTNVDQWGVAQHLDVAAVNIYHPVQDKLDGLAIALSGDLNRSLKQRPYYVTETNAQGIGWDARAQFPPYDNQLRLAALAHAASGASLVAYWHWHSLHYGQETYWRGVLGHDLEPNRAYGEVSRIGAELKRLGSAIAPLKKQNRVAILFSNDSYHAIQYMPFSDSADYLSILQQMYGALYRLNVEADFITPDTADWSSYSVLLVPPLYAASDATLAKLAAYVRGGGHVVVALKSGFADEHSTVRAVRAPGPLAEAAGFTYQEFSSLAEPLDLEPDAFQTGGRNRASGWAEFLEPFTARPLLRYQHPFFGRWPAVTLNQYGKGSFLYQGTVLNPELQQALIAAALDRAGLPATDRDLPVRVRHGVNAQGARLHFYLNFSPAPANAPYRYANGRELLSGRAVARGSTLALEPWGVAILAE